jgi:hypothetical protein
MLMLTSLLPATDTTSVYKTRKLVLGASALAVTGGSLIYLNQAWYQQYNSSSFHFFNDNDEWFQMDKYGHVLTTYQTGRLVMGSMKWAGYPRRSQLIVGGMSGLLYMSAIEVMDGYSNGWGFSWGDMGANALGSGLAIGQEALWKEQRIQLKFSFYQSPYAQYRTDLLGKTVTTQVLKDYNGQTYWLSVNPSSFFKTENRFPKWISIAVGYGADGMLGARDNNVLVVDEYGNTKTFDRYRQYYLSLDVDFTRIPVKSKFLKAVFSAVNIMKIPFPNMELSEGKLKFNAY